MRNDLSTQIEVKFDQIKTTVTASSNITGNVIDLCDYNDIMVKMASALTAGKIAVKIETADDANFTKNVAEVTEDAIKSVVEKGGVVIRDNKKDAIALQFTSSDDKKLTSVFGIARDELAGRYLRITYMPNASAAVETGLNSVIVLNKIDLPTVEE